MKKAPMLAILFFTLLSTSLLFAQDIDDLIKQFSQIGREMENQTLDMLPLSAAQEEEIGDTLHAQLSQDLRFVRDKRLTKVERIMPKLLQPIERDSLRYEIHLVKDDTLINAFSLAGGHLYVTTKIMDWVDSEDELVFIIGHEIGHVDRQHCVRRVKKMMLAENIAGNFGLAELGQIAAAVQVFVTQPFAQEDELEADRAGAYLTKKAGYNPRGGLDFFQKMEKMEEEHGVYGEPGNVGEQVGQELSRIFRTHPYSRERKNRLKAYIDEEL